MHGARELVLASDGARLSEALLEDLPGWLGDLRGWERGRSQLRLAAGKVHDDVSVLRLLPAPIALPVADRARAAVDADSPAPGERLTTRRTRKLVMIRDRMGIKPLYYYPTPDGVLFGSEPKAMLANPLVPRVVDADGLRELFAFVKAPGHAVWSGMREVEPGTIVTVDADGIRGRRYWRLETRPHDDDTETTVAHVRELLDDIVRRQLVADVPRCVLLSGGLDSSTITALSAAMLAEEGERVRSFAVDFVGQTENFTPDSLRSTPDTPFVHDVAEHVGAEHADIVIDHRTLSDPEVRRKVIAARDLPSGMGDMDASLYLLCKEIRERSTVALSGESADEIFGGYRQFHDPRVQAAHAFPWIAMDEMSFASADTMLVEDVRSALDLEQYRRDQYALAIAEVEHLPCESLLERRMRISSYLHLRGRAVGASRAIRSSCAVRSCVVRFTVDAGVSGSPAAWRSVAARAAKPAAPRSTHRACARRSCSRASGRRPCARSHSP